VPANEALLCVNQMMVKYLYHFLLQSYLNPVLLLVYLLGFRELFNAFRLNAFTNIGINNERLNIAWYLMLAPVIYLCWLVTDFYFLRSFDNYLTIGSILGVDLHWLQYLGVLFTALTLKVYTSKNGMEGNVMGFIFAPMLFVGAVICLFFHFYWVWSVVLKGGMA
jgi:hypothetical protein